MSATIDEINSKLTEAIGYLRRIIERLEAAPTTARTPAAGGAVFPNYGRKKGEPVAGADMCDLEYYKAGCQRTLGDSGKARWHDRERVLLAAIEVEITRQSGGSQQAPDFGTPPDDEDIPF